MLQPLYPWYPLNRRLVGTQSRFGHSGEEKIFLPLPGTDFISRCIETCTKVIDTAVVSCSCITSPDNKVNLEG